MDGYYMSGKLSLKNFDQCINCYSLAANGRRYGSVAAASRWHEFLPSSLTTTEFHFDHRIFR